MAFNIKELLTTSVGTEGSLLLPRKIYDELWDEVQKALVGRELAALVAGPDQIPGSSFDINLVTLNSLNVFQVAEGAAIPSDEAAFSAVNIKPLKYGVRPLVTKEMLEDGKWDLAVYNMRYGAKKLAENETSLILTALDGVSNTVSGGAAITIANITRAQQYLEDNDFKPKAMLIGPEVLNDIRNIDSFVESDKLGSREMFEKGFVGRLFGMNVLMFSANAAPTTTYSKYAYVLDTDHCFAIAEKRPVTLEDYDDKAHDMRGVVITQRVAVALLRAAAGARITTS